MFAQESVMDVQKQDDLIKEAFEIEAEEIGFCLDQLWGDYENPYENSDTALAFNLFKKGWLAKAQAVPEGFVLVPEDQAKDTDRLNFLLGGEKYIRTVIHRDIQNDEYEKIGEHFQLTEVFWIDGFDYWENTSSDSERGAIDKAMIEAQEPAND